MAQVPEDKIGLVPEYDDSAKLLDWFARNEGVLVAPVAPANVNVGTGTSPAAQGTRSDVTFDEYKKYNVGDKIEFRDKHPEQAAEFSKRLRTNIFGS